MPKRAAPRAKLAAVALARQQRRAMTLPELKLWSVLRTRPGNLRFRKQHPVGDSLSLDFFCPGARLAIEVDGEAHSRGDRPARDSRRDAYLQVHAIRTLRVTAVDVLRNLDGVVRAIVAAAQAEPPHHHSPAASGPPPLAS